METMKVRDLIDHLHTFYQPDDSVYVEDGDGCGVVIKEIHQGDNAAYIVLEEKLLPLK